MRIKTSTDSVKNRLIDRSIKLVGNPIKIHQKVEWECTKCNYIWEQTSSQIIHKMLGCPKCSQRQKLTDKEIDTRLLSENRNITRLSPVLGTHTKLNWKCNSCEYQWEQSPCAIINRKLGCPSCANKNKLLSLDQLNERLLDKQVKIVSEYRGTAYNSIWQCNICEHQWSATPSFILARFTGCPNCSGNRITNLTIDRVLTLNSRSIKRIGDIINSHTKIEWECIKCDHTWRATPTNIIHNNSGCPNCSLRNYSSKAINWLNLIMRENKILISHAENNGEFLIPNTKFRVDGFNVETNTIYEFLGDFWHGNPKIYLKTDINRKTGLTFGELFHLTFVKFNIIKSMGYNIIYTWEHDYDKSPTHCEIY